MNDRAAYRSALAMLLALAFADTARADDAAALYDPSAVSTIDITLAPEAVQGLTDEPKEYVDATLRVAVGGQDLGPRDAEVKLKGNATFRVLGRKAAFKIKLPKTGALLGLRKLTLNNMVGDRSMAHETLGYEVLRSAGIPAPRTGFAYVRVNDQPYGLYLNLETYDDISLARLFATTQHLYEADPVTDVTPGAAGTFEVDEGDEDDRGDLEALIAAANATGGDWSDSLAGVADLDQMTRMWAGEQYIGHWDGYSVRPDRRLPNNYYLHSDETGRFTMLPSGIDQTFGRHDPFPAEGRAVLITRCRGDDSCLQAFRTHLGEVSAAADEMGAGNRLDEIASVVSTWRSCADLEHATDPQWQDAVLGTRDYIRVRRAEVAEYLGTPAPVPDPSLESTDPPPLRAGCPLDPPPAPTPTPTAEPEPAPPAPTTAESPGPAPHTPRVRPRRLTTRVAPRRDTTAPFRFTITGRLLTPAGTACAGRVSVRIKAGKRTISLRRTRLGPDCRFSSSHRFASRRRFANRSTLRVHVRFRGNAQLLPLSAARRTVLTASP